MNIFCNLPELNTNRLTMRKMLPSDCYDMYEYASQEKVTQYLLWSPHISVGVTKTYLNSLQRDYNRGHHTEWALIFKDNKKMIGTCGFTRIDLENKVGEIGYVLNPEYWGMGIACEATNELLSLAFDYLKLERVEVRYMAENHASRRVAEKCGMTYEGVLRHSMFVKGAFCDIGICSIISCEYYKNNKQRD